MPERRKCCNPLRNEKHKFKYKSLVKISEKYNQKFINLIGQYVCRPCINDIYRSLGDIEICASMNVSH